MSEIEAEAVELCRFSLRLTLTLTTLSLKHFIDTRRAHAAADAHGDDAAFGLAAFDLVEELGRQLGARGAQGMAQGDGAAVGVDVALPVALLDPDGPARRDGLGGEGLVDLEQVDVLRRLRPASFRTLGMA